MKIMKPFQKKVVASGRNQRFEKQVLEEFVINRLNRFNKSKNNIID